MHCRFVERREDKGELVDVVDGSVENWLV